MRNISNALLTYLQSHSAFIKADLFTFTLLNGRVLRYTSADRDVVFGGNTYLSSGLQIARSRITWKLGVQVDAVELTVGYKSSTYFPYSGLTFPQLALRGDFQSATVEIDRLFMPTWGDTSLGIVILFVGRVAPIKNIGRASCQVQVRSLMELLNTQTPRNVLQPGCRWTLFDAGCMLNSAAYLVSSSVTGSASTRLVVTATGLTQASGYFDLGRLQFTSGQNNGFIRTVRLYTTGSVQLVFPLPYIPGTGDTFTILPGCDKLQSTCQNKFSNLINFGGEPYVPQPETAL